MKWNPYGWHVTCSHCGNTVSSNRIDCPYCGQNIWLGYSPSEYTESIKKTKGGNATTCHHSKPKTISGG